MQVGPEATIVYLPEDRCTVISPYGLNSPKLGPGIHSFSRLPSRNAGTCPGATRYCESVCYAKRVRATSKPVWAMWGANSKHDAIVPPPPDDAEIVRFHVSGDFDSIHYIRQWVNIVRDRSGVQFFGYTRSWRVPVLVAALEVLRDEPNVVLFASTDPGMDGPEGWREASIDDSGETPEALSGKTDGVPWLYCPEETGAKDNCADCGYCFNAQFGDVMFSEH